MLGYMLVMDTKSTPITFRKCERIDILDDPSKTINGKISLMGGRYCTFTLTDDLIYALHTDKYFVSERKINLSYISYKIEDNKFSFIKFLSPGNETLCLIQIKLKHMSKFLRIFKKNVIVLCDQLKIDLLKPLPEGTFCDNFIGQIAFDFEQLLENQNQYIKKYCKKTIATNQIEDVISQSILKSLLLPKDMQLELIQFIETETHFYCVYEPDLEYISLKQLILIENFDSNQEERIIVNTILLLKFLKIFSILEKKRLIFPKIGWEDVLVSKSLLKSTTSPCFHYFSLVNFSEKMIDSEYKVKKMKSHPIFSLFIEKDMKVVDESYIFSENMFQIHEELLTFKILNTEVIFEPNETLNKKSAFINTPFTQFTAISGLTSVPFRDITLLNASLLYLSFIFKKDFSLGKRYVFNLSKEFLSIAIKESNFKDYPEVFYKYAMTLISGRSVTKCLSTILLELGSNLKEIPKKKSFNSDFNIETSPNVELVKSSSTINKEDVKISEFGDEFCPIGDLSLPVFQAFKVKLIKSMEIKADRMQDR